ncbi:methyltransferase domain-containing protein [Neorhizobium sp. P12A]|uniref:methyltransferase n=1 Tax=Neorhizobium sp. P12A TaxID=2268027 RepID=UPI0011EC74C8|nr:methyltransferase [Neorhizobium sp. P12A]KAA0700402.1 methyltransferase domain-containing protein [Neorhizobium sp. P12A]
MSLTKDEAATGEVSPALAIEAMFAFRSTAAIKAAIELDVFTAIGAGDATVKSLAATVGASERGLRILCDFLVVEGFLLKQEDRYLATPSTRMFLDRQSPAYMGAAVDFIAAPEMAELFLNDPSSYVRNGGAVGLANVSPDNPVWIRFARAMGAFTGSSAESLAAEVATWPQPPRKVLDIAAGPGRFGIEIARTIPSAKIVAVDWQSVLALSEQNAQEAGVAERYQSLAGSAFDVDWGGDYDLILLPNFLHHFDADTCVGLLKKVRSSLGSGGRVVGVEFVPNEDRISPSFEAEFSFEMLATTPAGDAYTKKELDEMARRAGFRGVTTKPLSPSPASLVFFE